MKKIFFIIGLTLLLTISNKVYALEVNQKISDNETIEEIDSIDIKVKGTDTKLSNFLTTKWRTYVKLDELCSSDLGVCKIKSSTNQKIILTRNYENLDDVYYETEYTYKDNKYKSKLIVPNSSSFDFGETDVSPDVKPVKIEKDVYVPIRFITEALGAEVIYENKSGEEKAKVKIDFYSNMNLDFNVKFYDINTIKNDDYSTMEKYDFKDLTKNNCYDIVVKANNKNIFNAKLFSVNSNFIKIDYNNNVQTNICLKSEVNNKSLDFIINYKNVPIIYNVDETTLSSNENVELDKIYLTGDTTGMTKENEVKLSVKYVGTSTNFEKYATLKWQGSSSIAYEKKNYTIKLFESDSYDSKYKISINNWTTRNKYVLKANYVDYSQARNIVSAKLWGDVVRSRKDVDKKLSSLPNGGAIDGYPVLVYINDEYQGLYTFNTAKDEDLFNMKDDNELLIISDSYKDDSLFKASVDFSDTNTGWEILYDGNKNEDEVEKSINNLINFAINNDGSSFKNGIDKYLDVDATIDYMIYMYYILAADNTAKNMLWVSLDGIKWFPSPYDLDSTFGNGNADFSFYDADVMLPVIENGNTIDSSTPHRMVLWTRMLNNYKTEIKNRYNELRKEILTSNKVIKLFKNFKTNISDDIYNDNLKKWPNLPNSTIDNYQQIFNFIKQREKTFDNIVNSFK